MINREKSVTTPAGRLTLQSAVSFHAGRGCRLFRGIPMWFKVECTFFNSPKIALVGWRAGWAYLEGLAYCVEQLTDGKIPYRRAREFASKDVIKKLTTIQANEHFPLWLDTGSYYLVHDYLKHQKSKEQILDARDKAHKRNNKSRASKLHLVAPYDTPYQTPSDTLAKDKEEEKNE